MFMQVMARGRASTRLKDLRETERERERERAREREREKKRNREREREREREIGERHLARARSKELAL